MDTQRPASARPAKLRRALIAAAAVAALVLALTPQVLATDVADIGIVDQAAIGNLSQFQDAKNQLTRIQDQLQSQFQSAIKGKSPSDQQRISTDFQNRLSQAQHQIFDPLLGRANAAIAQVAANKGLSVVVDKQIVIFGGLDITKDVTDLLNSPGQVVPPVNTPAPSEIGYVDRTQLDALPKMKAASDQFVQFQNQLRAQLSQQVNDKTPADQRQKILAQYQSQMNDERNKVLQPLVDQTDKAISSVAKSKSLLLIVNAENRVYGGTDVTADVVKALQ
ncbi:MAG TPA: OmpH family outer membrane protein [Candidatus Eremiobacteraceae bacterium]|nr:OmpH family outer membrane protein [Candidatus Eremiobacteraceae bacterium]